MRLDYIFVDEFLVDELIHNGMFTNYIWLYLVYKQRLLREINISKWKIVHLELENSSTSGKICPLQLTTQWLFVLITTKWLHHFILAPLPNINSYLGFHLSHLETSWRKGNRVHVVDSLHLQDIDQKGKKELKLGSDL